MKVPPPNADIVDRLRFASADFANQYASECDEAANEIERLRDIVADKKEEKA